MKDRLLSLTAIACYAALAAAFLGVAYLRGPNRAAEFRLGCERQGGVVEETATTLTCVIGTPVWTMSKGE